MARPDISVLLIAHKWTVDEIKNTALKLKTH
ncbi:hypothetical protein MNBD_GAMMA10-95 [hydrothermal vent metagenome]|uniref:Uncharacterized protein n=1 Tax=hydrothermal vent metagenome TaxID=652676 RepID=A0A3B0YWW2_9ZZZZ